MRKLVGIVLGLVMLAVFVLAIYNGGSGNKSAGALYLETQNIQPKNDIVYPYTFELNKEKLTNNDYIDTIFGNRKIDGDNPLLYEDLKLIDGKHGFLQLSETEEINSNNLIKKTKYLNGYIYNNLLNYQILTVIEGVNYIPENSIINDKTMSYSVPYNGLGGAIKLDDTVIYNGDEINDRVYYLVWGNNKLEKIYLLKGHETSSIGNLQLDNNIIKISKEDLNHIDINIRPNQQTVSLCNDDNKIVLGYKINNQNLLINNKKYNNAILTKNGIYAGNKCYNKINSDAVTILYKDVAYATISYTNGYIKHIENDGVNFINPKTCDIISKNYCDGCPYNTYETSNQLITQQGSIIKCNEEITIKQALGRQYYELKIE